MVLEEDEEDFDDDLFVDQMETELVKGKPYSCPDLQPFKGKQAEGKEPYLFNSSIAKKIFDYLVKDH